MVGAPDAREGAFRPKRLIPARSVLMLLVPKALAIPAAELVRR